MSKNRLLVICMIHTLFLVLPYNKYAQVLTTVIYCMCITKVKLHSYFYMYCLIGNLP